MRLLERAPSGRGRGHLLSPRLVAPEHVRLPITGDKYDDNLLVGSICYAPKRGIAPSRYLRVMPDDYLDDVQRIDDQIRALRVQRQLVLDEAWRRAKPVRIRDLWLDVAE